MVEGAEKKKNIVVDPDKCIGCDTCEGIAPKYFKVEADGLSHVKKDYDEKDADLINEAIDSCPTQAISLD